VAPILRAKGHEVYTPTLTGLGASSHLIGFNVNLSTHVRDISNLMFYEDLSKVNLVGHSYAGMVITGVAGIAPERLSRLIYLDAIVPDPGESEFDYVPPEERFGKPGDFTLDGVRIRSHGALEYLGITDPELGRWVSERLTNQPLATYEEHLPPESKSSAALPRVYIHCTQKFTTYMEKAKSRGWNVRSLAAGHDSMLTAPQPLATMLMELAT
jgi:pimeloyl-ACP methyl ester carboxylesterase